MNETIRDNRGNVIGHLIQETPYRIVAKNARGNRVASYNPQTNETKDALGNLAYKGNALVSFLTR